jgi:(2Fe-2S) ferredoxin
MADAAESTENACVRTGCTRVSSQLAEPLLGTAPHARAWLLLVHPGPWPGSAPTGLLDSALADKLELRCAAHDVRMAAVRGGPDAADTTPYVAGLTAKLARLAPLDSQRPRGPSAQKLRASERETRGGAFGPETPADRLRRTAITCYVASTGPGRAWLARVPLAELKDLLDLDLGAIANGVPPATGERIDGPLYAVCTHGKRDTCCAVNGRPVHRALSRLAPGRAWEATHLGGHRFAANMLVLPEGLLYGRVDTDNVGDIVERHARGEIVLDRWRGRTAVPQPAQAAEWFARRATGQTGVDDVALARIDGGGNRWQVDLRAGDQRLIVGVEQTATGSARLTGCAGDTADPGRWRLVSLRSA